MLPLWSENGLLLYFFLSIYLSRTTTGGGVGKSSTSGDLLDIADENDKNLHIKVRKSINHSINNDDNINK